MYKYCEVCATFQRYIGTDTEEHRQLFSLIEKMLEYEPAQRILLADALDHAFFNGLSINNNVATVSGDSTKVSTVTPLTSDPAVSSGCGSDEKRPSTSPVSLIEQL